MKKIFLLMTIMTSLFFALSIDSKAFTFNNEDSPAGITLDTNINELNGYSLRDTFEDNNLINYNNWTFEFGINYFNEYIEFDATANQQRAYQANTLILGNEYYTNLHISDYLEGAVRADIGITVGTEWNNTGRHSLINTASGSTSFNLRSRGVSTTLLVVTDIVLIDLSVHGLTNTKDELDYYYTIYTLLKKGIDPTTLYADYYTEGQIDGYSEGYGDGYSDGNTDGYNNGYSDGQEDGYDTGYLDGNVAGLETGYNNGYNDGYSDGVIEEVDTQWLLGFVTGTVNVLGVSIIPGISLGVFVFIPLFLGFIGFIFRLGGRRG